MFAVNSSTSPYHDAARHARMHEIIRRHSTNTTDVRDFALAGLDLNEVTSVLDLGCGFGFMAEAVAARISHTARIVGVDACESNREPFLARVRSQRRGAEFVQDALSDHLRAADSSFDLATASYSLNFFPQLLPEISRVLKPEGLLIVLAHTAAAANAIRTAAAKLVKGLSGLGEGKGFSDQNGSELLRPCFRQVNLAVYPNRLAFSSEEYRVLYDYLAFKYSFSSGMEVSGGADEHFLALPDSSDTASSVLEVCKDDIIYRCRSPIKRM